MFVVAELAVVLVLALLTERGCMAYDHAGTLMAAAGCELFPGC